MGTEQQYIDAIGRMAVVPTILDAMARLTGMRFTAVARVTDTTWTACAVRDEIAFGLKPGDELQLVTTICNEIRQHGRPVIFGSASTDDRFREHPTPRMYGFESYVSIPIFRADDSFFGTLCAIDPRPAKLDDPVLHQTLELFAKLIGTQLDAQDLDEQRRTALAAAADARELLEWENQRITALLSERDQVERVITRELNDTRRLRDVAARLIGTDGGSALYGEILEAAIEILDGDAGTIQLLDERSQTLSFLATRGFPPAMVAHFAEVDASSGSPCGIALATGARSFVRFDDPTLPDPDGSNRLHLSAGVRSAQSTPLVSRAGRPIGMFSTHWSEPRELNERELRFLDLLGRQAADLIERNQVQEALLASERELREEARRKDEFIAVLAHELRNPLAPIRSGIEVLKRANGDARLIDRVRPMMERQIVQVVHLIDDLLDVSRIRSGKVQLKREWVSLRSLVESALEAHRGQITAGGIELLVELDDPERQLDVDPTRLSQVISNVLHNAVKFTAAGGRIAIRASLQPAASGPDMEQVLRIQDSGVGIAAEMLPNIFDLFTQARSDSSRHGGMGIGLALSRSLMELHGGAIEASSSGAGHGSEFVIRLPVSTPAAPPPAPGSDDDDLDLAGLRVLVVDDNQDAADGVAMLLTMSGGEVRVAYDATRIVDDVRAFDPGLVLLDIGLPGVDGYQACRHVREEIGPAVHIVALTGWGQEEDQRRAKAAGFDAHLTKPVDLASLALIAARASKASSASSASNTALRAD
ncbi:GAF domain-containing protein [Roseateles sp. UC29_93]|uniref:hybrid sensor histidine kinase/response regulator n=1 Tax=Roseateles sp. UC29_93 TaxID=3350177 RepID=UPI00366E4F9F